jgi:hypothetical protein
VAFDIDNDAAHSKQSVMSLFSREELRTLGKAAKVANQTTLYESAGQILIRKAASSSDSAIFDIFLSHRHLDNDEVLGLVDKIESMGFSVYVDTVEDAHLKEEKTSKKTADTLRQRMKQCKSLFFATSKNYTDSKWMPWELGYFDGLKQKVAVCPVADSASSSNFSGQEYLSLYPYIERDIPKDEKEYTLWVHESADTYITFKGWLNGKQPTKHIT